MVHALYGEARTSLGTRLIELIVMSNKVQYSHGPSVLHTVMDRLIVLS